MVLFCTKELVRSEFKDSVESEESDSFCVDAERTYRKTGWASLGFLFLVPFTVCGLLLWSHEKVEEPKKIVNGALVILDISLEKVPGENEESAKKGDLYNILKGDENEHNLLTCLIIAAMSFQEQTLLSILDPNDIDHMRKSMKDARERQCDIILPTFHKYMNTSPNINLLMILIFLQYIFDKTFYLSLLQFVQQKELPLFKVKHKGILERERVGEECLPNKDCSCVVFPREEAGTKVVVVVNGQEKSLQELVSLLPENQRAVFSKLIDPS